MAIKLLLGIILVYYFLINPCKARHYGFNTGASIPQSPKVIEKLASNEEGKTVIKQEQEGANYAPKPRDKTQAISVGMKKSVNYSWHLPNTKHDQYPGMYADYPKPRSRPPSHN